MNTRQTMRIRDDPEMALRRRDVNDEEYDQHWRTRLLPGNQQIYDRDWEQSRQRHEEYCGSTARNVARRYASRGAPGPRIHRPPGRVTGPSPRDVREDGTRREGQPDQGSTDLRGTSPDPAPGSGTQGPRAHLTQERHGASQ